MHAKLVGDLALLLVAQVAVELLAHVGEGVQQAFLGLAGGERRVVLPARLFVEEDGDDVRARGVLHVGDHAAKHGCQTGRSFEGRRHICPRIIGRCQPPLPAGERTKERGVKHH